MNKLKSTTLALGTIASVAAPVAGVISCGSDDNVDTTRIRVAYEKSWASVVKATLKTLTPEEQAKFDLVEIDDGKSVDYLDQVTLKPAAGATADLFAAPVDHFSSLADGGITLDLGSDFTASDYQAPTIGLIDGKHYAYPINTESVIQIFNKDQKTNGYTTLKEILDDTKSVSQWGNLWVASSALNAALVPAATAHDASGNQNTVADKWVKKATDGTWSAPVTTDGTDFEKMAKALWTKNQAARSSSNADFTNIANGVDKDSNIRKNLTSGNISGIVDGPWIVNDLVARAILAHAGDVSAQTAAINNIGVKELPTIGAIGGISAGVQSSHMRHFNGGWGYSINKLKLASLDATKGAAKKALEVKFLKALTSSARATDWFKAGGKISAAAGATVNMTRETVAAMKLSDPTTKGNEISLPDDSGFATALGELYTRVGTAVANQSKFNVDQPSGKGWNLWGSWDKEGISSAALKSETNFWSTFKQNVTNVITEANT